MSTSCCEQRIHGAAQDRRPTGPSRDRGTFQQKCIRDRHTLFAKNSASAEFLLAEFMDSRFNLGVRDSEVKPLNPNVEFLFGYTALQRCVLCGIS